MLNNSRRKNTNGFFYTYEINTIFKFKFTPRCDPVCLTILIIKPNYSQMAAKKNKKKKRKTPIRRQNT